MSDEKDGQLIKAATNEHVLLVFRAVVFVGVLYFSWIGTKILNTNEELTKQFHATQIATEARIGKLEGTVSVIDNAIRMQSRAIETNQSGVQQLWNRLYEMRVPIVKPN